MFNKKEILYILIVSVFLAFAITLIETWNLFLYVLISVLIVLLVNALAKKIAGYFFESEVEMKLWEFRSLGILSFLWPFGKSHPSSKMKTPFPAGLLIPLISKIFLWPLNGFVWMASMVFDVKPKSWRVAKRHGYYSFSEMTEDHIGYIAAFGIIANLIMAFAGYLIGYPLFSRINIWFVFFNMIPISNLDGNKIFFGKLGLWNVLAIITLLALAYSFFLV